MLFLVNNVLSININTQPTLYAHPLIIKIILLIVTNILIIILSKLLLMSFLLERLNVKS